MPTDPFVILGLNKSASQQEILDAYKTKRAQYESKLFAEGEEGAEAARIIENLDNAYQQAMEICHEQATVSDAADNGGYEEIKQAIRDKNPELAQQLLDKISYRGAEWHYFQSIIYYEKNWLNDSKKQLEIALELEPDNPKYKRALENIKKKINGEKPFSGNSANGEQSSRHYGAGSTATNRTYSQSTEADAADGLCAACQALWCADCCCECLGGDLIRCC